MLPTALVSVYREYRKDTNSIVSWLASTAKECGYPADLLPVAKQQAASTERLKGKARKKEQGKQDQSSPS
jgi:hypothetical protein